jgi:hypothetical protein
MLYEVPEEKNAQNVESCASSWQACVSHQLIFVRCMKEDVDVAASRCTKSLGSREVTLIQMSFANCDIWIALAGDGVTFVEAN